jgi:type II secretory pathway pseudopilin PulG
MASRNESGTSIIELMVALGILSIAGAMVSQYLVRSSQTAQQLANTDEGERTVSQILSQIRKKLSQRDGGGTFQWTPNSLTFAVPTGSASHSSYDVTFTTRCRSLPAGQSRSAPAASNGLSCFNAFTCSSHAVPYVEVSYVDHPAGLSVEKIPSSESLDSALQKKFATAGLGLCFDKIGDILLIKAVGVSLENTSDGWSTKLVTETTNVPVDKRNKVDIMP